MKKKIIIGCFISILVLLMLPSIPATNLTLIKEAHIKAITHELMQHEQVSSTHHCIERIKEIASEFLSEGKSKDSMGFFDEVLNQETNSFEDGQPLFFPFLGIFIYLLIFYIAFLVFVAILRNVFTFIGRIIDHVLSKFHNFINIIVTLVITVLTVILMIIKGILQLIGITGLGLFNVIRSIITTLTALTVLVIQGIIGLIVLTLRGMVTLIRSIWNGLGAFFRLMTDIFVLILDFIFPNLTV